jgi:hypothetical protein
MEAHVLRIIGDVHSIIHQTKAQLQNIILTPNWCTAQIGLSDGSHVIEGLA